MRKSIDNDLIAKYLSGDEESFALLVRKYTDETYGFAMSFIKKEDIVEDIFQDTFLKVWKNIKKFDQKKDFKTWFFQILRNTIFDWLRKKSELPFSYFDGGDSGDDRESNIILETISDDEEILPHKLFEKKESVKMVTKALEKISPSQKEVLLLYFSEDLNFREIGEVLGESIDTVKSRYRRALLALKKVLENMNQMHQN
ncbi:MAG: RNA polymerase sigma factor [Candidatus Taylorbacteria bacterium]|nr:RNA polymerase sigma factor [Candidatus Taylorbacteria bacterium]